VLIQSVFAQGEPTNFIKNGSFEEEGVWEMGPETTVSGYRALVGERIVLLDGNDSYVKQKLTVTQTGIYQLSTWVSTGHAESEMSLTVNGELKASTKPPKRMEWHRRGIDDIRLEQGDVAEIYIRSNRNFIHLDDVGLYLQATTPFRLDQIYPYKVALADLSEIWHYLYIMFSGIAAGVIGSIFGWHHRHTTGGRYFAWMMFFATINITAYLWEVLDVSYVGSLTAFYIKYTAHGFYVCALVFLSLWYCGRRFPLQRLILLVALAGAFINFTDPWLHLGQKDVYIGWGSFRQLQRESFGFFSSLAGGFFLASQAVAFGNLSVLFARVSNFYRKAIFTFSLGYLTSLAYTFWGSINFSAILPQLSFLDFRGQDASAITLGVGLWFFLFAVWRFRMLELSPTAWGKVQTNVSEPILALSPDANLIELNESAKKLFSLEARYQRIDQELPDFPTTLGVWRYKDKDYQVEVSNIQDINEIIGKRIVLHDITELRKVQLALQEANEKLQDQAIKDGLTGIYNRRYLDTLLEQHKAGECSLILFDIDYFREFNARYGYGGGDFVLKSLAAHLQAQFIYPCRYGGEEFCIVLPDVLQGEAVVIAEELGKAIEALKLEYQGRALTVTVSLGVASLKENGSRLLAAADRALQ
jgi:diguanylate cyclase (GGDEF)-like protein